MPNDFPPPPSLTRLGVEPLCGALEAGDLHGDVVDGEPEGLLEEDDRALDDGGVRLGLATQQSEEREKMMRSCS